MRANTKAKPKARAPKNRKKGWRQTDIKDVEDHLEDERLQERTGYETEPIICGRAVTTVDPNAKLNHFHFSNQFSHQSVSHCQTQAHSVADCVS